VKEYVTKNFIVQANDMNKNLRTGAYTTRIMIYTPDYTHCQSVTIPFRSIMSTKQLLKRFVNWIRISESALTEAHLNEQLAIINKMLYILSEMNEKKPKS